MGSVRRSVTRDDVRVDGHTDVEDRRLPRHTVSAAAAALPPSTRHPPLRSAGRSRQKVEKDDNWYSSGCDEPTSGRGVSNAGQLSAATALA